MHWCCIKRNAIRGHPRSAASSGDRPQPPMRACRLPPKGQPDHSPRDSMEPAQSKLSPKGQPDLSRIGFGIHRSAMPHQLVRQDRSRWSSVQNPPAVLWCSWCRATGGFDPDRAFGHHDRGDSTVDEECHRRPPKWHGVRCLETFNARKAGPKKCIPQVPSDRTADRSKGAGLAQCEPSYNV